MEVVVLRAALEVPREVVEEHPGEEEHPFLAEAGLVEGDEEHPRTVEGDPGVEGRRLGDDPSEGLVVEDVGEAVEGALRPGGVSADVVVVLVDRLEEELVGGGLRESPPVAGVGEQGPAVWQEPTYRGDRPGGKSQVVRALLVVDGLAGEVEPVDERDEALGDIRRGFPRQAMEEVEPRGEALLTEGEPDHLAVLERVVAGGDERAAELVVGVDEEEPALARVEVLEGDAGGVVGLPEAAAPNYEPVVEGRLGGQVVRPASPSESAHPDAQLPWTGSGHGEWSCLPESECQAREEQADRPGDDERRGHPAL